MRTRRAAEEALVRQVKADPGLAAAAPAWDAIAAATRHFTPMLPRYTLLEEGRGFFSTLFSFARLLVRAARSWPSRTRSACASTPTRSSLS